VRLPSSLRFPRARLGHCRSRSGCPFASARLSPNSKQLSGSERAYIDDNIELRGDFDLQLIHLLLLDIGSNCGGGLVLGFLLALGLVVVFYLQASHGFCVDGGLGGELLLAEPMDWLRVQKIRIVLIIAPQRSLVFPRR